VKRKDKILSKLEHLKRIKKITDILDKEAKREMEDHLGGINEMVDHIVTGRRKGRAA